MDFCEVVGSFGRWQLRVFLFFAFLNVVGMWQNFSILFLAGHVPFRCAHNASLDSCRVAEGPNSSVPCARWEFDTSHTSHTIVSEWDLVCEREWLVSLTKAAYMAGYLFSVIVFGQISDCVGRYPTIIVCYVITIISMFLTLLSNSFPMFLVLRFLQAFGRTGATTVGFVLLMETVGPKHHEEVGIAIQFGFVLGYVTLAGVAWFFRHWFWLQLVISLAFLPFAPAFRVVPESPRWLQTRGKTEKLKQLLATAARVNRRKLKAEAIEFIERKDIEEDGSRKSATMFQMMKLPNLRKRTFKMIYLWFVNAFLYYAVAYSTSDLAGDPYVNCFLAGVVEIPARGLVFFGIKKWGRRPTLVLNMALAGAFFLADLAGPGDLLRNRERVAQVWIPSLSQISDEIKKQFEEVAVGSKN
ncbi:unnamed protein product [Larinioides sclopetarius]|uniref:Major facilitator superfamily (MFS) profile domain-containing protein n=2 Tax=Larinioides sclopetarius TaxID=280406 RepID=A0AAV2BPB7_9ARAC